MALKDESCTPCEGKTKPLGGKNLEAFKKKLANGWKVVEDHHLENCYYFPDFKGAWRLNDKICKLAEKEGHHPVLELSWGRLKVTLWTHAINGLSDNDFIMAAKIDEIERGKK